jgi:hypothetical protein
MFLVWFEIVIIFQNKTKNLTKYVHLKIFIFIQFLKKMTYWGNYKYNE